MTRYPMRHPGRIAAGAGDEPDPQGRGHCRKYGATDEINGELFGHVADFRVRCQFVATVPAKLCVRRLLASLSERTASLRNYGERDICAQLHPAGVNPRTPVRLAYADHRGSREFCADSCCRRSAGWWAQHRAQAFKKSNLVRMTGQFAVDAAIG